MPGPEDLPPPYLGLLINIKFNVLLIVIIIVQIYTVAYPVFSRGRGYFYII